MKQNKNPVENKYKIIASITTMFLLAALVVAASFWSFSQSKVAAQAQKSTYDLIMHTDSFLSELKDAETGQRGYLLVGDEVFLEPYWAALDKIVSHLDELHHFTFVNAAQKHLDTLSPLVNAKITEMAYTIELRRRQDMAGVLAIMGSGQGKRVMDSIRAEISSINQLEQDEQVQHIAAFQLHMRYMLYTTFCASLLMIVFLIAMAIAGYSYLKNVQGEALSRLQKISSLLPGMVFQFCLRADGSSYFPFVSEAIRNIYRISPEEVHEDASKVFASHHPDDSDGINASIQKSAQDLSPWHCEYRVKFDDDTVNWLLGDALLQREVDGSTLWYGFITDITERKKIEENFKKYRSQLESFIKQVPISIAMFDLNMNYLANSDRWLLEFGQGCESIIGRNHYEMFPDLPAEWKIIHQQGLAGESLKNDDDLWLQKDGSKYWLRWAISPWFNEQGLIGGIIISSENITQGKQTEETLRVIEKRLELAVECAQIGVWELDLIHNISWRSLGHDQIFGYESPLTDWNFAISVKHVVPEDRAKFSKAYEEALRTGKLFIECQIIKPDHSLHWINVRGSVLYDENARAVRMLGTVVDITEHKNLEEQAKLHMDKLAHVTRLGLLGEMASGIAHEVNQPLTAIATYAQVSLNLIKKENPDLIKLAEIVVKTQQQALRAGSIIHRMKAFGKPFSKQHATANINTLINDAIELCIVDLKQNGVRLDLELTNNLPPVFVDPIQIEQVIINLIRNSTDALQSLSENQQRKITIQSQLTLNNDIQVSVKDNGLGIVEDQKQKILTPFFTTKISGTGMGLSISRSLIEAHEGTLYFNSEFGKGSTFYFTLPIETAERG